MPDITIVKLKIRRGTNTQRQSVILEQGELGYTTDTRRVFIGDGNTPGGTIVANITHPPINGTVDGRLQQLNAVKGDLIYDNQILYQLTGDNYANANDWTRISVKTDEQSISYVDNLLTVKMSGISGKQLHSSVANSQGGIKLLPNGDGLSTNVDNSTIKINTFTNQLSVGYIDHNNIASTALGSGLSGGNGLKLSVNADQSQFDFDGNQKLIIRALPTGIVSTLNLSSNFVGDGLYLDNNLLKTNIQGADDNTLEVNSNKVQLKPSTISNTALFKNIAWDAYGRVSASSNIITTTLSCNVPMSSSLSAFNGYTNQTTWSNQTIINVISAGNGSTNTVSLTSAGFMVMNTNIGQLAVPVYKVPSI